MNSVDPLLEALKEVPIELSIIRISLEKSLLSFDKLIKKTNKKHMQLDCVLMRTLITPCIEHLGFYDVEISHELKDLAKSFTFMQSITKLRAVLVYFKGIVDTVPEGYFTSEDFMEVVQTATPDLKISFQELSDLAAVCDIVKTKDFILLVKAIEREILMNHRKYTNILMEV